MIRYCISLITCLVCTISSFAQTSGLQTELLSRLKNARQYTLQVAEAMPEATYGYRPSPDEMTYRAQLVHIAQNLCWLTESYLSTKPSPVSKASLQGTNQTKAETLLLVNQAYTYAIDAIGAFDLARLDEVVPFFAGPMTKRQILLLLFDHQTHHRGQLIVYLRLNGIKPPGYVGW